MVDIGAYPLGTFPAVFAVAAPFFGAFQTYLAALLADQRAVAALPAFIAEGIHTLVTAAAVRAEILRALLAGPTARAEVGAILTDRAAAGTEVLLAYSGAAIPAVVFVIAAASALRRAMVAADTAVADVVVRDEITAELAGALHVPGRDRKYETANVMIVVVIMVMMVIQSRQWDKSAHQLKTKKNR